MIYYWSKSLKLDFPKKCPILCPPASSVPVTPCWQCWKNYIYSAIQFNYFNSLNRRHLLTDIKFSRGCAIPSRLCVYMADPHLIIRHCAKFKKKKYLIIPCVMYNLRLCKTLSSNRYICVSGSRGKPLGWPLTTKKSEWKDRLKPEVQEKEKEQRRMKKIAILICNKKKGLLRFLFKRGSRQRIWSNIILI